MNLHEYQGKQILSQYGVRVQRGLVAYNADEAVDQAKRLSQETGTKWWVVKAQIHAGGRGKGGGVKLAKSIDEVREKANDIIGMMSVSYTHLRAHETVLDLVCRLLLEKKKNKSTKEIYTTL